MSVSRHLVRAARALTVPPEIAATARLHLLDAIGVGLAAAAAPVGAAWRAYAGASGTGPATAFGRPEGIAAADAALVNGGLMHSLEYDGTHTGSIVHGSATIAAATLALAEARGLSGAALLDATVRGWEVLARFGLASPGAFQARGFQVTSVAGALVAALVAAELRGLDENCQVAAIGIALSQASGVFEFLSNGSSVKSLHPGWAAHAGLVAAALAEAGMTGPETAIEGRYGLFASFAGGSGLAAAFEASLDDLGAVWHLPAAAFKLYPCCHYIHPFIEAAERLAATADEIGRLTLRIAAGAAPVVCEPWTAKLDPPTPHAARWSLPVVVAAQIVQRRVDLATFEEAPPEAVRALAARCVWEPLEPADFPRRFEAEIVCECRDGRREVVRVADVRGNASRPIAAEEIGAKFAANAGRVLQRPAVAAARQAVESDDLPALTRALRRVRER